MRCLVGPVAPETPAPEVFNVAPGEGLDAGFRTGVRAQLKRKVVVGIKRLIE